ncbi:hypothetical protein B0H17DRAFT_1030445 [Mycena rosella]|uniref:Transcription factor BYE1 n=1 Tax=Mycena rosella TaxID=1033263 RepID=A0AAD7GZR6_MYCRO|nr:hypothetical protein B0H17DRAFT_1030445 [Mycena rosella]
MSTRARTRTASTAKPPSPKPAAKPKAPPKSKRSEDIENDKPKPTPKTKSKRAKSSTPAIYCVCRKSDDGSPMVNCGQCDEWYHFTCINLSEQTAEDINVYICPSCTEKTGHRTVMLWEGPDAVEDASKSPSSNLNGPSTTVPNKIVAAPGPEPEPRQPEDSAEEDPSSEDEYVAESLKAKGSAAGKRRRARRLSFSSESGSGSEASSGPEKSGRSRKPASPGASKSHLKRKAQQKAHAPPPKRKKAASDTATDDPARAFCLGKLEGVFRDIFLRYPHVRTESTEGGASVVETKAEDLSEEEKATVEGEAKQFATDLEQCVYDIYSEPDKQGQPSAGGKYKERFRMLQFNLSKVDRTVLHKRIASADITPKEISLMSSTDLANEQTKQSIKIAEKEALEHSILEKTVVPRAKLTHKGLEDIEGLDDDVANLREREIERQREEERERLRAQRQRTMSVSVPPESPTTPAGTSWGGPPRVPIHALTTPTEDVTMGAPFGAHASSEMGSAEPEMNLADLINIDDELAGQDSAAAPGPSSPPSATEAPPPAAAPPSPTLPTGISPFASKPEPSRTSSFDLNSFWAAPQKAESPAATVPSPPPQSHSPAPIEEPQERKDELMDLDETEDQDFDMFLDEKADAAVPTPEALEATFNALPQVWSGKINMPLDSTIPQETPVIARQVGGRPLEFGSVLWQTLFPSELLRIDGRVPVDKSAQFLLQARMNSTKELIAVAFSPRSSSGNVGFQILTDFLIAKGRHGLVFPWGPRPKDTNPGKDLYIIPLLSSDSLPDYMELLDNLHLPKIRNTNYLIGIWVLNKGKLAPPPPPPAPAPAPVIPQFNVPTLAAPPVPGMPAPPMTFEPSVLAAEVAALTPEQVRMMLQSLTATTLSAIPVVPTPMPPHSHPQPTPPLALPQSWGHPGMPGPSAMGYSPPPMHHQQQHQYPDQHGPPYGQQPQPQYERREYNRDQHAHPGPGYDRGGRDGGWSSNNNNRGGRGRGRGRGVGGAGGGPSPPPPPADSGWPRRRDNGPPSPVHRRW